MILLHQEEVDLLKTFILFPCVFPHPEALTPREMVQADSLHEVPLDALKTYIMHCFAGWHALRALGSFGCRIECVQVSGWAAGVDSLRGAVNAGISNRR